MERTADSARRGRSKACVPCMVGNARNKPRGASKPNAKHIPPDQQLQRFEEEYAASKKGQDMSKSALNFMHKHEGRQPSTNMSTLAYQSIDEITDMKPMQKGTSGSTNVRHARYPHVRRQGTGMCTGLWTSRRSRWSALWAKSSPSPRPGVREGGGVISRTARNPS
jgi:hypothetical protein